MLTPARNIWDTRIHCLCAVIVAREAGETDLWMCTAFAQASKQPPRIIINPNRLYPIEGMIRRSRRFSLNVMAAGQRRQVLRLLRLRRREPRKAEALGWALGETGGIPTLPDSIRTLICELETALHTGDHTMMVARVVDIHENSGRRGERALLYREVAGDPDWTDSLRRVARRIAPVLPMLKARLRPLAPADLPAETYRIGGQTDEEVSAILAHGVLDRGRVLSPPAPARAHREPIGICVVGTHWGALHCDSIRKVNPSAKLYVCGQQPDRTARFARATGAEDFFTGLEAAVRDPRVDAMVLALPHHMHAPATLCALAAGKHVLVEKPIANSLEDADRLISAAASAGRILMVAENMHFRPAITLAAERIRAGDLGEPLAFFARCGTLRRPEGWAADRDKLGGGVFLDIGIHYVRAMRLLMGEPDSVLATRPMQVNTKMTGEDSLNALFESRYGWQGHLFTTWSGLPGAGPDVVIIGEKGTLHLWPGSRRVDCYPAAPRPLVRLLELVRPYRLQRWLMRPTLQRVGLRTVERDTTGYPSEIAEFLAAIAEGRAPATTAADARRDLEIVLQTYRSLDAGARVVIPSATDEHIAHPLTEFLAGIAAHRAPLPTAGDGLRDLEKVLRTYGVAIPYGRSKPTDHPNDMASLLGAMLAAVVEGRAPAKTLRDALESALQAYDERMDRNVGGDEYADANPASPHWQRPKPSTGDSTQVSP